MYPLLQDTKLPKEWMRTVTRTVLNQFGFVDQHQEGAA